MFKNSQKIVWRELHYRRLCFSVIITAIILCSSSLAANAENTIVSPNKRLKVEFYLTAAGAPRYSIMISGKTVLLDSKLGLVRDDADFTNNLKLISASKPERVSERYEILTAKRRFNNYQAMRTVFHLQTADGKKLDIVFQISDDGAAFRYFFPETDSKKHSLRREVHHFIFCRKLALGFSRWRSREPAGKNRSRPTRNITRKKFPLERLRPGCGLDLSRTFSFGRNLAARQRNRNVAKLLRHAAEFTSHRTVNTRSAFPDPRENFGAGAVNPESRLPWLNALANYRVGQSARLWPNPHWGLIWRKNRHSSGKWISIKSRQIVLELDLARRRADEI